MAANSMGSQLEGPFCYALVDLGHLLVFLYVIVIA